MDKQYQECIAKLVEIILSKHASQAKIAQDLRKALVETSGTQSRRVLYNNTYGGFGYSREFAAFIKSRVDKQVATVDDHLKYREADVEHVQAFGKELIEQYPILSSIFEWYAEHGDEQNRVCVDADFHVINIDRRDQLDALLTKIKNHMDAGYFGSIDEAPAVSFFIRSYWNVYPRESLHYTAEALESLRDEAQAERQELDDLISEASSPSPDVLKAMQAVKSAEDEIKKENEDGVVASKSVSEADQEFVYEMPSKFLKALEANGPEAAKTWASQTVLSAPAVMYFLAHKDDMTWPSDDAAKFKAQEAVGLLAASGQYCDLCIDEVPVHSEYSIGEYDGKERVYLL